jgi:hypothetical protein
MTVFALTIPKEVADTDVRFWKTIETAQPIANADNFLILGW